MSNQALYEKLDQTSELLYVKLAQLIRLSALENTEDDDDNERSNSRNMNGSNDDLTSETDISVATSSIMMVKNQTMQLIKGVQDLLLLTRSIREKWILNQIPQKQNAKEESIDHQELEELLENCMEQIIGESEI